MSDSCKNQENGEKKSNNMEIWRKKERLRRKRWNNFGGKGKDSPLFFLTARKKIMLCLELGFCNEYRYAVSELY